MAANMGLIAKKCFPNATQVTDRFHVQKLALEALQEIRIKYRWQAIDQENNAIEKAKKANKKYESEGLTNGDAVIFYIRTNLNGQKTKWTVPHYYLNYIPISKKHMI